MQRRPRPLTRPMPRAGSPWRQPCQEQGSQTEEWASEAGEGSALQEPDLDPSFGLLWAWGSGSTPLRVVPIGVPGELGAVSRHCAPKSFPKAVGDGGAQCRRAGGSPLLASAVSPPGSGPPSGNGVLLQAGCQLPGCALAWLSPRHGELGPMNSEGDPNSAHPSVSLSHVV